MNWVTVFSEEVLSICRSVVTGIKDRASEAGAFFSPDEVDIAESTVAVVEIDAISMLDEKAKSTGVV